MATQATKYQPRYIVVYNTPKKVYAHVGKKPTIRDCWIGGRETIKIYGWAGCWEPLMSAC